MSWRARLISLGIAACLAGAVLSGGCATSAPSRRAVDVQDPLRRPGMPVVLIAMPRTNDAADVRASMMAELKKDFDVVTLVVGEQTGVTELAAVYHATQPVCVVLMNNSTVKLYTAFQRLQPPSAKPPAAVMVLASLVEDIRGYVPNATGIAYEVPGVTAFVNLRSVTTRPIARVGVVHRPSFRGFVARQRQIAAREKIEIVAIEVGREPSADEISGALRDLGGAGRPDALWILNDNGLLKDAGFVTNVWRPSVQALGVPVIVGVAALVNAEVPFGTFAVLPDHDALGVQTANLIYELRAEGWSAAARPIELPLSTQTLCDMAQMRDWFGLREEALKRIDKAVE